MCASSPRKPQMCCMAQVTRAIDRTHTWGTSGALGFTHNGCARLVHSWRPLQTCLWVTRLVQRHRAGNVAMRRVRSCIVLKHTRTYLTSVRLVRSARLENHRAGRTHCVPRFRKKTGCQSCTTANTPATRVLEGAAGRPWWVHISRAYSARIGPETTEGRRS